MSIDEQEKRQKEGFITNERKHQLFVAEDESEEIVGYIIGGENRYSDEYPDINGELYAIYILETAQYEGLGQRLVYTLVEWLKENDFSNMLVWVLADNSAKLFYKKLGAGYLGRKKLRFLVSYWKRMCICGEVSIVSIRPVTKGIQTNRKEDIK